MGRVVSKEEFKREIRPAITGNAQTIALCHGVFDVVHPGHISHFLQAKNMADILVVSVTASEYVRKGPGRPYFDDEQRLKFLSEIECIDYVMLSEGIQVDDIIEAVEPDYYVKGSEYSDEESDVTGGIRRERELVERHGGEIRFTGGEVFSSTRLINNELSGLSDDVIAFMKEFKKKHSFSDILAAADRAEEFRVLVIGDVIIDRYTYCRVQGLMSKDMAYSARWKATEEYYGGALAIARHLSTFVQHVSLMSVIGNEKEIVEPMKERISDDVSLELIYSDAFPTIVKHRYLQPNEKREEYKKIFVITNIPDNPRPDDEAHKLFVQQLNKNIEKYDAVFLCDFGHGLIDDEIMEIVQDKAKCLILNCQTNSSNHGMNIITKYRRADWFSLDQSELKLACPAVAADEELALGNLIKQLGAKTGWLTRGALGALGMGQDAKGRSVGVPAFTLDVKDTIGAGDAFYAIAGLYAAAGADTELSTVMGNIAGALGANIIGNKDAVDKVDVLKYATTLLNV